MPLHCSLGDRVRLKKKEKTLKRSWKNQASAEAGKTPGPEIEPPKECERPGQVPAAANRNRRGIVRPSGEKMSVLITDSRKKQRQPNWRDGGTKRT